MDQGEVAPPSGAGHAPQDVHERQPAQHKAELAEGAILHDAVDGGQDRLQDTRCNGDQGSTAAMLSVSTPFSPVGTPGSCAPLSSSALAGLVSSAHDGSGASSNSHHLLSGALLNGGGGSVRPAQPHPQQSEQASEGGAAAAEARERGDAGASSCSSSPSSTSGAPREEPGCGSDASDDSSGSTCGAPVHSGDSMHSTPAVPTSFGGGGGGGRPMMGGDPGSQICYDFTKGLCTRGDKCKFSHDIATIVQFNSKEKGICFDYLRNQCHRGLLCRFSHDLSNIAQQCQVFNSNGAAVPGGAGGGMAGGMPGGAPGGGPMPTKNRSGSICYDFVKGVCSRGPDCRYSHDLTLIARMARTSNGAAGGPDADGGADVCFDFLRSRCSRGDGCKYSHNPALLGGSLSGLGAPPNPLLPGGFAGSPGMLFDPAALAAAAAAAGGPGWPLAGMTPQTAAAAAAAAAAAYAASGDAAAAASLSHKLGMMGLGGGEFGVPPPGMGGPGRGSFDGSGLGNDPLAMLMAMQQHNPMLAAAAAAAAGGMRPPQGPGLPPLSVNARGPGMGPPGGRMPGGHGSPTPEQLQLLMATNPELGRLLSKSAPGNGSSGNLMLPPHCMPGGGPMLPPFGGPHSRPGSSLGMNEQRMSPDGLSAGMPIPPHLLHPHARLAALASSGSLGSDSPAGSPGSSMSMGELLAAAAAARGASMHGQHSNSVGDMAAMRAAAAAASRSAPMSNLGAGAPGRLSPSSALSGPGPRGPGGFQQHHHHASAAAAAAAAHKHAMDVAAAASAGMVMPPPAGPKGIGAGRGANAQAAAAAAAAIAAVAARSAEGGGPAISQADIRAAMEGGPEGTMLPLLQEIWSR